MSTPLDKRCYVMSEPHLSGYRLIIGFETLADVQAAHEYVARLGRAADEPSVLGAGCGTTLMPNEADRRDAYKRLYVARMVGRGIDERDAMVCFDAGDVDYDINPEDAVDNELSYWDADE